MKRGLVTRALIACGLLTVLIGGAFTVLLIAIQDLRHSGRQALVARQELAAADNVEKSLINLETGQRGFIITEKERFLQPWLNSRKALPALQARLIQLSTQESPIQGRRARRIADGIGAYIRGYSVPLVRAARRGDPSAGSVAATQQGKSRMDALRARFSRITAPDRHLITSRQDTADADAYRALVLGAAGLAGSVVLILIFGVYLVRGIVLPIRRTSEMASRLAEGDLRVRLPETGAGEIGALERSFNQMGASLQASYEELRASRARVVAAGDETRRRIKRDLHDGAQQGLVRTVITLKLARRALGQDQGEVAKLVDEALVHANGANVDLRELAHGILPAVLTRGGLRAGVESLTSRVPIPVTVDVMSQRLPQSLEATGYFITAEALTNVVKHAEASRAEVHAHLDGDALRLVVRDDGVGGANQGHGSGLIGLTDRAAAAGGRLRVESSPGNGTVITATLPVPPESRDGSGSDAPE